MSKNKTGGKMNKTQWRKNRDRDNPKEQLPRESESLAATLLRNGLIHNPSYGTDAFSDDESMRKEIRRWLNQTRWEWFYTLTFKSLHSLECRTIAEESPCGESVFAQRGCRVPGMRTILKAVGWFQTVVPGSFLVTETGKLGRLHLHGLAVNEGAIYLGVASSGLVTLSGEPALDQAFAKHRKTYGRVDAQEVHTLTKAVDYVTKYVTKEMYDARSSQSNGTPRWWLPDSEQLRWRSGLTRDDITAYTPDSDGESG
jgi:hypothetical protein